MQFRAHVGGVGSLMHTASNTKEVETMIARWRLGDDALIHRVWSLPFVEDDEPTVELVSGADATAELMWACEADEVELLFDERGCFGYVYEDIMEGIDRVEFWDCDEQSWSEYEREVE